MKQKEELEEELNKLEELYSRLNTRNIAIKTLLNSLYGITAFPYSRYFNWHISESITSCARHTIKQGEKFVNEILNEPSEELVMIINELK